MLGLFQVLLMMVFIRSKVFMELNRETIFHEDENRNLNVFLG
jgi:hypothetical protein